MTNGEKLVKTFPDIELYKKTHGGIQIDFDSTWWNAEYKEPTIKNDLGVDCISRAYLYNRIKGIDHDEDYECDEFGGSRITYHTCDWDEVLREIEDAPSVTPQEQKIGHWIDCKCDKCGYVVQPWNTTNFCPNCGANMKEVEG